MKTNDNLNEKTHMLVNSSLDNFMKYNPPCKECLVQVTCIKEENYKKEKYFDLPPCLIIIMCKKLIKFLIDNNDIIKNKENFKRLLEIIDYK
jgi:hypothetical protein